MTQTQNYFNKGTTTKQSLYGSLTYFLVTSVSDTQFIMPDNCETL